MKAKSKLSNRMMMLVSTKTGLPIHVGDKVVTFRGEAATVLAGTPPRTEASTGRVHIELGRHDLEVYPSVIDAQWVPVTRD
jgi:hypothetical protein